MNIVIEHIGSQDLTVIDECVEICNTVFSKHSSGVRPYIRNTANWDISLKATHNNIVVGCYILNTDPIHFTSNTGFDLSKYKNLRGLHGVGLAVLPEYRDRGIGRALREYPDKMGYDYIYGMHLESLNNLENWKKVREVVYTSNFMHVTLKDFRKKITN
jgi:GNAT superfamily N-acetyltransferase